MKSNASDECNEGDVRDSFKRELVKDDDIFLQYGHSALDEASPRANDDKDSLDGYNELNITVTSQIPSESDDSNSSDGCYTFPTEIYDLSSLNPVVRIRKLEEPLNVQKQLLTDKTDRNCKKAVPRGIIEEANVVQCISRQSGIKDVPKSLSFNSKVNNKCSTRQPRSVPRPVPSCTESQTGVSQKNSPPTPVLSAQNCEVIMDNSHEVSDADEAKVEHFKLELPIKKKRSKKIFYVHLADLISLVKKKKHPLHKWAHLITVDNVKCLPKKNYEEIVNILTEFLEVRAVSH